MSDPVTNVQIEDVLSSIRRLVSTDGRTESKPEETQEAVPEKLVLTPSLRVDDDTDSKRETDDQGENLPDRQNVDHLSQNASDEQSAPDSQWAETDHAQSAPAAPEQDYTAENDAASPVADVWSDDEQQGEDSRDHHDDSVDDHDDRSDLDDEVSDDHDERIEPQEWQEPAPQGQAQPENDSTRGQDPSDEIDQDEAATLTARVAGFEEAVAARDETWEPDGDSDGENAAQPMEPLPWQDDDQDAASTVEDANTVSPTEGLEPFQPEDDDATAWSEQQTATADAAVNAFRGNDDPLGDEASILDEDALRDLVTEIVREELQGALGERITRNVRKLVRREINRALATQELE